MRIGIGYDSHRFAPGRRLVLGGVEVPHALGLAGHSDADAVAHAVTDAVLGAVALGDIGAHFPPSDERWRDADSLELLRQAVALAQAAGYAIGNVDVTVVCEAPRLGPHVPAMRERLAAALHRRRRRLGQGQEQRGHGLDRPGRGTGGAGGRAGAAARR